MDSTFFHLVAKAIQRNEDKGNDEEKGTCSLNIVSSTMSVTGLFAGIGGFEVAFGQVGIESNLLVEIDCDARIVLGKRFPDVALESDILDLEDLPKDTTILTCGFPCQNLSMAGDKSGIEGKKSGTVRKMLELIGQSDVPTVVIENVCFMLQLDAGKAIRWLADEFEKLGYDWAYRVLNTRGFGLPQRRRRVYLVASRALDPRTVLFADEQPVEKTRGKRDLTKPLGFYWTEGRSGLGLTVDGVPPLKVGSGLGIPSAPAVLFEDGEVLMPSIEACERLQGFDAKWTAVSNKRTAKRGARWSMVGNAVSVPVAEWVAKRILDPGDVHHFEEFPLTPDHRWPTAAWCVGGRRVGVVASDKPVSFPVRSIRDFRDSTWNRLSHRALGGFIRRAEEGRLRMPKGFLESLRRAPRRV